MTTIRREIRGKIFEIKRIPLFRIFGGSVAWIKIRCIEEQDGKEQRLRSNTPERNVAKN